MSLKRKLEGEVEIRAAAGDVYFDLYKNRPHHLSHSSPQGHFGKPGSIILWRYNLVLAAMENKHKLSFRRASFVKVLDDNFIEKLEMPPSFVNIFEGDIPPWLILEISGSRKCWRVDVEDDENGRVYLSYGFNCFIKAHSLEPGNFLLFEYEKPSILQVKIYEKDGSERANESTLELEYEVIASKIHEGKPSESPRQIIHVGGNAECPRQPPIVDDVSETPRQSQIIRYGECEIQRNGINNTRRKKCMMTATRFSLSWRKARHFLYYMTIPKPMLVDKTYSNNETVLLKDTEGNSWQMELRVRKDGRVDLAKGWREFVNDSDLMTGDVLIFEFLSNNMILIQILRANQAGNPSEREQDRHSCTLRLYD